jgi:vacuolar-type H+-ATPase subunit F/Vma7
VKLYCLGDEHTVRGLRLAGVEGCVVTCSQQGKVALQELRSRPDCAVLLVTEEVASGMQVELQQLRVSKRPLLLEVPGPQGSQFQSRSLEQLLQEAVGIRLQP